MKGFTFPFMRHQRDNEARSCIDVMNEMMTNCFGSSMKKHEPTSEEEKIDVE